MKKTVTIVLELDQSLNEMPYIGDQVLGGTVKSVAIYDAIETSSIAERALNRHALNSESEVDFSGVRNQINTQIKHATDRFLEHNSQ